MKPVTEITDPIKLAWLAGLLEGEGCFVILPNGSIAVALSMTDHDVVRRAAELFGSKCHEGRVQKDHHKTPLITRLNGRRAAYVMTSILPLMGERRARRIEECLKSFREQQERIREQCAAARGITDAELLDRHAKSQSLRALARDLGQCHETVRQRLMRLGALPATKTARIGQYRRGIPVPVGVSL